MAKRCFQCGRGSVTGISRSHSKVATRRRFHINLQTKRLEGVRRLICTRCIKTMNKVR